MKNKASPIPSAESSAKRPPQGNLEEKSSLEAARNGEGSFQPHNSKKEALGPNTKR
mgnify:CR=1 FL=1